MRITVPGRELKSCFKDMSGLLKKYEQARVIGITTTKTEITFTVDAGTYYCRSIQFTPVSDVIELSLTVLFVDLSHFISGRDDVKIELTEFYVAIASKGSTMTLNIGESLVAPYKPRGGTPVTLDYGMLRKTASVFTKTQDLQKAFNREFAIMFYGDKALMKSPIVWIETQSQGLDCALSVDQLKSILMFQPDSVEVSDRLEFKKGSAILSLSRITPTEPNHMPTHLANMTEVAILSMQTVLRELVEMKRAIGMCECELRFGGSGFSIKVEKNGISLMKSYGDMESVLLHFRYPLDLFIMCLNLLGDEEQIVVLKKEGLACLQNMETSILLSVLS